MNCVQGWKTYREESKRHLLVAETVAFAVEPDEDEEERRDTELVTSANSNELYAWSSEPVEDHCKENDPSDSGAGESGKHRPSWIYIFLSNWPKLLLLVLVWITILGLALLRSGDGSGINLLTI